MYMLQIKYIWLAPWNIGKVLYIFTRYPAFLDQTLFLVCA